MPSIRYRIRSEEVAIMDRPDTSLETAFRALTDANVTLVCVTDDSGRELLDAVGIARLVGGEEAVAAQPWNDTMLASMLAAERGDIRPDLPDDEYQQLAVEHFRRIHEASPETLEWVKAQLETLSWRVEDFGSSVREWFILELCVTERALYRPVAVATTVRDVMALLDEALEWKTPDALDLAGRIMYLSEDREYRIIRLPRRRAGEDWSAIRFSRKSVLR